MGAIKSKVFGDTQDEDNINESGLQELNSNDPTFRLTVHDNDNNLNHQIVIVDKSHSTNKSSSHHFPLLDLTKLESKHQQKIRPYTLFDQSNPNKKKESTDSNKENKMETSGSTVTSFQPPNHLQKSQYFRSFRMASRRIFNPNVKKLNELNAENKNTFKSSEHISTLKQDTTKNNHQSLNNNTNNIAATTANNNNLANTNDTNLDTKLESNLLDNNAKEANLEELFDRNHQQQSQQTNINLKSKSTIDFSYSIPVSTAHSCLQQSATSTKLTDINLVNSQAHNNYSKTPSIQVKSFRNNNCNSSSYFSSIRRRFTSNSNNQSNNSSCNINKTNNTNLDINANSTDTVNTEMLSALDPRKLCSTSIIETFSGKINNLTGFGSSSTSILRSEPTVPFLSFNNITPLTNDNNKNNTPITSVPISTPSNATISITKIITNCNDDTKTAIINETLDNNNETTSEETSINTDTSSTPTTSGNSSNMQSASVSDISKSNLKNANRESVTSSSTDWEALTENQNKNENLINDLKKQIDSLNKQLEHLGREDSKIINELSEKIENLAKMNVNIITAIGTQQENKFRASFFGRPRQPSQTSEAYYARLKQQNDMLLLQQRQIEQLRKDLLSSFVSSQSQPSSTPQPNISQNATFVYPETPYYNTQNYNNGYARPTMSNTYPSYQNTPYSNSTYYFSPNTPNPATPTPTMSSPTFSGSSAYPPHGYAGTGPYYINRNGAYTVEGGHQYFYYPPSSQAFQRATINNLNPNNIFYDPNSGQYFQYQRAANMSQAQYLYNQSLNSIYANIYAYRKSQVHSQQNMNENNNTNSSFDESNKESEQTNVIITEVASDDEDLELNSKFNNKKDYIDAISLNDEEI